MSYFRVNENCNGCLACVENCPASALDFVDQKSKRTLKHSMTQCARCGQCWRICPQICYDLRFPAWCRNRGEYDLLVFVASWPDERRQHWRGLLRARAIENQCYVVGVNRIGEDGNGYRYVGDSAVCEYSGEPIVELGREPRIATVSLDLAAQAAYREKLPFLRDADDYTFANGKD